MHVAVVPEDELYLPLPIRKGQKQLAGNDSEIGLHIKIVPQST
jgi:hypothetical protein